MSPEDFERIELIVANSEAGARLDTYLTGAVADMSRSRAKALILKGHIAIGDATIVEPKRAVKSGDRVNLTLPPPEPATPAPEAIPLTIVHEDKAVIVIDKPAGLVVHPGAGNRTGTLVNALIAHCGSELSGIGGVARPGIVHRLDKDTTGLLVVAKTDRAHRILSAQFADHGRTGPLERGYRALVWGAPTGFEGTIEAAIARSRTHREKMAIVKSGGREATTHYRVTARYGPSQAPEIAALLDCRLETGRTHQIRVHLASIGHPVIGDRTYGSGFLTKASTLPDPARELAASFPRQALHAWLLAFEHPETGTEMRFESPFPDDMDLLRRAFKAL